MDSAHRSFGGKKGTKKSQLYFINIGYRFTIQILQSLCLLYEHRIIHCDLKPEVNFLRNGDVSFC